MKLKRGYSDEEIKWITYKVDPDTGNELSEEEINNDVDNPKPFEEIKFGIRKLLYEDTTAIQDEVYSLQTNTKGKGNIKSSPKYGSYVTKKLSVAIVKWENVLDESGNPAKITSDNMRLLPAWLGDKLMDEIDRINNLTIELEQD